MPWKLSVFRRPGAGLASSHQPATWSAIRHRPRIRQTPGMRGEMLPNLVFTNSLKSAGLPAYRTLRNTVDRHCRVSPALFLLSYDSACAPVLLLLDGARQVSGKTSDASLP